MKKLILFFIGFILLGVIFASLYCVGAVYDASQKLTVETYFFQGNNLSSGRVGTPQTPTEMGDTWVADLLVQKFVSEYFYVIPDSENIAQRTLGKSVLAQMSSSAVFNDWKNSAAQDIQEMASDNYFRTAHVIGNILRPAGSDYWTVFYELRTWTQSNNMNATPDVSRGVMYINVTYENGIRDSIQKMGVHKFLDNGGNPAVLFKFRVNAVAFSK